MKDELRKLVSAWRNDERRLHDWECADELESLLAREDESERVARERLVKSDDDTPYLDAPITAMVRMPDGRHFRCADCGANCFTRRDERFHCNGCDAVYIGERTQYSEKTNGC